MLGETGCLVLVVMLTSGGSEEGAGERLRRRVARGRGWLREDTGDSGCMRLCF